MRGDQWCPSGSKCRLFRLVISIDDQAPTNGVLRLRVLVVVLRGEWVVFVGRDFASTPYAPVYPREWDNFPGAVLFIEFVRLTFSKVGCVFVAGHCLPRLPVSHRFATSEYAEVVPQKVAARLTNG